MYLDIIGHVPNAIIYMTAIWWTTYALSKLLGVWANSCIFQQDGHYYKVKIAINSEIDHVLTQEFIKQGEIIMHYLGTSPWCNLGHIDIIRAFMGSTTSTTYETRLTLEHSQEVIRKTFEIALNIAQYKKLHRLRIGARCTNYYQSYLYRMQQYPDVRASMVWTRTIIDNKELHIRTDGIVFGDTLYSYKQFPKYVQYMGYNTGKQVIQLLSQAQATNPQNEILRYFKGASDKLQIMERNNTSAQARMRLYAQTIKPLITTQQYVQCGKHAYIYLNS